MKQYKITSENLVQNGENDAYLAPDDPIHQLKAAAALGGLGSAARLQEYTALQQNKVTFGHDRQHKADIMRTHNIKPGDEAWFKLWFGRKGN